MTLKELNEMFDNKDVEIVFIDKDNMMCSINTAEAKTTGFGKMITLKN